MAGSCKEQLVYKLEPAEAIGRAAEEKGLLLSIKGTYAHTGQQTPELPLLRRAWRLELRPEPTASYAAV